MYDDVTHTEETAIIGHMSAYAPGSFNTRSCMLAPRYMDRTASMRALARSASLTFRAAEGLNFHIFTYIQSEYIYIYNIYNIYIYVYISLHIYRYIYIDIHIVTYTHTHPHTHTHRHTHPSLPSTCFATPLLGSSSAPEKKKL